MAFGKDFTWHPPPTLELVLRKSVRLVVATNLAGTGG